MNSHYFSEDCACCIQTASI